MFWGTLDTTGMADGNITFRSRINTTFQTGGSNTRMTIESGGDVGIGTTNPAYDLDVNANINYSGSLTNVSDRRIKKNIVDIDDEEALDMIRQLQPKKYNYIDTDTLTNATVYGYIA